MDVVGQAGDAEDLLRKVRAHKPDVAVVDIRMPPTHTDEGLRAAATIRERAPADRRARALASTSRRRYALELLADSAEGVGYLLKDRVARRRRLRRRGAPRRGRRLGARPRGRLAAARPPPPRGPARRRSRPREREVLGLMAEGRSNHAHRRGARRHRARRGEARHVASSRSSELPPAQDDHRRVLAVLAYLQIMTHRHRHRPAPHATAGRGGGRRARRRRPSSSRRRASPPIMGAVGLRQVDAHARASPASTRRRGGTVVIDGVEVGRARRREADRAAPRQGRLHLPGVQPAAGPDRARRTSCCRCRSPAARPTTGVGRPARSTTVGLRDRLTHRPSELSRRPAAARRRRPRARLAAGGRLRRRADRQPRLQGLAPRCSSCCAAPSTSSARRS